MTGEGRERGGVVLRAPGLAVLRTYIACEVRVCVYAPRASGYQQQPPYAHSTL